MWGYSLFSLEAQKRQLANQTKPTKPLDMSTEMEVPTETVSVDLAEEG